MSLSEDLIRKIAGEPLDVTDFNFDRTHMGMAVVLTRVRNGEAIMLYTTSKEAANALGVCPAHLRQAIVRSVRCRGVYPQWLPHWLRDHDK